MTMMEMTKLDLSGDSKITWDSDNPVEVENARRMFNEMKLQGFTAHIVQDGKSGPAMSEFDPNAEGLVMVPQMTAG